ncbi:MAG: hypothetical protein KC621_11400 [Myxococcales bacterium]|nr:hypothetical protein [Myxococcales bacterium]
MSTQASPHEAKGRRELAVQRMVQPDLVSCGPTCLFQVARFYGDERPLSTFLGAVQRNPDGGTLAVHLANAAMDLGYRATLYPFGIRVFDPTWWELPRAKLLERVARRRLVRPAADQPMYEAWEAYLARGGRVVFHELTPELLVRVIDAGHPLIGGMCATWFYREAREIPDTGAEDDVAGEPSGHFVVVAGYSGHGLHFHVRDPHPEVPDGGGRQPVAAARLLTAILLGDLTHDAVLLEIAPRSDR